MNDNNDLGASDAWIPQEQRRIPVTLTRYLALSNKEKREHAKHAIIERALYFSSPNDFNDPFDCHPAISLKGDERAVRDYFYRMAISRGSKPPAARLQASNAAVRFMNSKPGDEVIDELTSTMRGILAEVGVVCFSEAPDHPLMWGHYSNRHCGICIGYDTEALLAGNRKWFDFVQVDYSSIRPRFSIFGEEADQFRQITRAVSSKHLAWSYEREWRLIMRRDHAKKVRQDGKEPLLTHFPREGLRFVVLGARIQDKDAELVRNWCSQLSPALKVHQARLSQTEYRVHIDGLDTMT